MSRCIKIKENQETKEKSININFLFNINNVAFVLRWYVVLKGALFVIMLYYVLANSTFENV